MVWRTSTLGCHLTSVTRPRTNVFVAQNVMRIAPAVLIVRLLILIISCIHGVVSYFIEIGSHPGCWICHLQLRSAKCILLNVVIHRSTIDWGFPSSDLLCVAAHGSDSKHSNLLTLLGKTTFNPLYFSNCLRLSPKQSLKSFGLPIICKQMRLIRIVFLTIDMVVLVYSIA